MSDSFFSILDRLAMMGILRPPGMGLCSQTGHTPFAQSFHKAAYGKELSFSFAHHLHEETNYYDSNECGFVFLGVPSGSGGGALPGASLGPIGIREALLKENDGRLLRRSMDLGDVLCIPHLLHDDLLNSEYLNKIRHSPAFPPEYLGPVSPLSVLEHVVTEIQAFLKEKTLIILGGDHSISASALIPLLNGSNAKKGVLHIDAHSDLAPSRYGLEFAYGSWAYRTINNTCCDVFVQIGLDEKEELTGIEQIPLDRSTDQAGLLEEVLKKSELAELFISIDIDAFDESIAPATGIPRKNGMLFYELLEIIDAIPPSIKIRSIDIVEVAPIISRGNKFHNEPTCNLAAKILSAFAEVSS